MHKLHTSVSVDCAACSAAQLRLVVVYWATPLSYKLLYLQVHTVHFSALKLNAVSSCPPSNTSENKLRLLCSFWKHGSKKRNSKHACELILNPFAQVYDTYTHKHKHTHTRTHKHTQLEPTLLSQRQRQVQPTSCHGVCIANSRSDLTHQTK